MPISFWHTADKKISDVLKIYGLEKEEFHTAWLLRPYLEQNKIAGFDSLSWPDRRREVTKYRNSELLRLQKLRSKNQHKQAKKSYRHTNPYIHLTFNERRKAALAVASCIASWDECLVFAECIDKVHFDPARTRMSVGEQAFEQVVSRFEQYLKRRNLGKSVKDYGILVHDNNDTVSKRHTDLMRKFHGNGTLWTRIDSIIETPLFVNSSLTRMVQMADLCSYALRRYVENKETDLFRIIFKRVDTLANKAVGIRHFAGLQCQCEICSAHHRGVWFKTT